MPSDPHPHIHTEIEPLGDTGRLAQVTVDNPTRLNVLDSDLIRQLRAAIRALEPDRQLRCVVLRGAGDRAFIGGADIREMVGLDAATAHAFITRLHLACAAIRELPVPVIARIHGYCLGAGLEIAASCDLRVASDAATFGMPEVTVGIPSVIEAALLPGLVGTGRARALVYTGESISRARGRARRHDPDLGAGHRRRGPRSDSSAEEPDTTVGGDATRRRDPGGDRMLHERLRQRRTAPTHAGVPGP